MSAFCYPSGRSIFLWKWNRGKKSAAWPSALPGAPRRTDGAGPVRAVFGSWLFHPRDPGEFDESAVRSNLPLLAISTRGARKIYPLKVRHSSRRENPKNIASGLHAHRQVNFDRGTIIFMEIDGWRTELIPCAHGAPSGPETGTLRPGLSRPTRSGKARGLGPESPVFPSAGS